MLNTKLLNNLLTALDKLPKKDSTSWKRIPLTARDVIEAAREILDCEIWSDKAEEDWEPDTEPIVKKEATNVWVAAHDTEGSILVFNSGKLAYDYVESLPNEDEWTVSHMEVRTELPQKYLKNANFEDHSIILNLQDRMENTEEELSEISDTLHTLEE